MCVLGVLRVWKCQRFPSPLSSMLLFWMLLETGRGVSHSHGHKLSMGCRNNMRDSMDSEQGRDARSFQVNDPNAKCQELLLGDICRFWKKCPHRHADEATRAQLVTVLISRTSEALICWS